MFTASGVTRKELETQTRKLVRKAGKQVLLIASEGRLFAIANRCPHEGYPLSEGTLGAGCVLTCNWHNWKFDLTQGTALVGRDPVRTYPIEERNREIFVDLADPPAEARRARALAGLEAAIADNDGARIAREVARLEHAGFDAQEAVIHAFRSRNDRLEEGMTHAYAAAADWLALAERATSPEAHLTALLEPIGHIAWDTEGANKFPYSDGKSAWDPVAFVAAAEAENEPAALALMRGALAEHIPYAKIRPAIAEAALAHYADFGHCAIYTFKIGQLIARLGQDVSEPVLLALTRKIVLATREERLPEFRFYEKALAAWDNKGAEPARATDFTGHAIDATLKRVLASSGRPIREIYDALVGAAAWNLTHFDLGFDRAVDNAIADNIGWLDFTHALTFANACRHICEDRPDLWPRALLQLALFIGRNRKYVRGDEDGSRWRVADRGAFLVREQNALYDHGIVEPIIACHHLKVLFALEDELTAAPDAPWADEMLAAVNRYLSTPMKRHHGLRTASQALDFVAKEA
ncbi:MAG: Rieske (2Fe-2S) protein [Rhizomicrobium sp.]|jgi:nitrite reductase/ring-hydroxylating ferredoxin subunit